jgi:hypothetical protein
MYSQETGPAIMHALVSLQNHCAEDEEVEEEEEEEEVDAESHTESTGKRVANDGSISASPAKSDARIRRSSVCSAWLHNLRQMDLSA